MAGHVESGHYNAAGVHGQAANACGSSDGVVGITNGTGNVGLLTIPATGVTGRATNSNTIVSYGVQGINSSTTDLDAGVLGWAIGNSGEVFGVRGDTNSVSPGAAGVFGDTNNSTGKVYGVKGTTGTAFSSAAGVRGRAESGSGVVYGVSGQTDSNASGAAGVRGLAADNGNGRNYGVVGETNSNHTVAAGVKAISTTEAEGLEASSGSGTALWVEGVNRKTDSGNFVSEYAVVVRDLKGSDSKVLALQTEATSPTRTDNFITFFTGDNTAIGSIEGDGGSNVSLNTSGADLGRYFPLSDPTLEPDEGAVLGLSAGELSLETAKADAALVVTRSPAVLGNNPKAGENEKPADMESVALIGQIPVKVTESVDAGDRLVAAGDDGTARVGGPDDDALTVGRALEPIQVADGEADTVRTFVGGPMSETPMSADEVDPQGVVEAEYEETIAELRRENEQIREENQRLSEANEELRSRLDDLEGTVENLVADVDATSGAEPADD